MKQEGIVFRHLLRLILLCGEFVQVTPPDATAADWQAELRDVADQLTASCRAVDPTSTDEIIEQAHAVADVVEGESARLRLLKLFPGRKNQPSILARFFPSTSVFSVSSPVGTPLATR